MFRFLIILFVLNSCSSQADKQAKVGDSNKIISQNHYPKIISDSTNVLENRIQELELEYIVWGCACANWITPKDRIKYQGSGLAKHCIFLEPSDSNFNFRNYFTPEKYTITVKGQFYQKLDYPKGTIETEESLEKAKVFRYTEFRVNALGNKKTIKGNQQIITVSYNAIACTCAQWTETKYDNKINDKEYIFLEKGSDNLMDADSLWDGVHLPFKLQLTGRFISESGYPKNYSPTKGDPNPARVFQYSSLKIVSKY
jgi:hypothetical protein